MFTLFDLDDTLYDLTATFRRSHHIMMERLGIKLPEDLDEFALFTTVKKHSNTSLQMTITGDLDPKDEFAYRFSRAYEEFGIKLSRPQLDEFEMVYRQEQNNIELFPGCMEMLESWNKRSSRIGILTNGIPETQKKKYRNLGLTSIIDEENVFVSGDLGYRKPDVNAFLEAARRISHSTSVNPADYIMVGDTYGADMKGALEAGFTTIWFNHRHNPLPVGVPKPDYTVYSMEELINLAKSI